MNEEEEGPLPVVMWLGPQRLVRCSMPLLLLLSLPLNTRLLLHMRQWLWLCSRLVLLLRLLPLPCPQPLVTRLVLRPRLRLRPWV